MKNSYTSYDCYYTHSEPFTKEATSPYLYHPKDHFKDNTPYNNSPNYSSNYKDTNSLDCICHDCNNHSCCNTETCHHNHKYKLVDETSYLDCSHSSNASSVFTTAFASNNTFFLHNIGCHEALVILQVSPDNRLFANDFNIPITVEPKKTIALVPATFAKFTRILAWTSSTNKFTTLLIYYQCLI